MKIVSSVFDQYDTCPYCGQEPGSPCMNMRVRVEFRKMHLLKTVHPERTGLKAHTYPLRDFVGTDFGGVA
jgi:hypothetical protein